MRIIFFAPFYLFELLVHGLGILPTPFRLLVIGVILVMALISSLTEQGPLRLAVIVRRFSWIGIPFGMLVIWWLWCTLLFVHYPDYDGLAVVFSGFTLLAVLIWCTFMERVVLRNHLNRGILTRAYRRVRFRLRWDSIAKSSGMAHERDVRPHNWTTGGTTIIRQRALAVQWTPTLWHGRRGADDTTQYLIRPARGLSAKHWSDPKDGSLTTDVQLAIALAAGAKACNISPWRRNWWKLTMFWSDPSEFRPGLET